MNRKNAELAVSGFNYISKTSYFESKHKSRPGHLSCVEEGRIKRTEHKSLHRKSARTSIFDNGRNISPLPKPAPAPTAQGKTQRRWQQLQQWKEEKEKKKLGEASKKKKKPFVVGTVKAPLAFELPPPQLKPVPSGRMTRSQSAKNKNIALLPKNLGPSSQSRAPKMADAKNDNFSSFAPANAQFHPPKIAMLCTVPILTNDKNFKSKVAKQAVTFDPVIKTNTNALQKLKHTNNKNEPPKVQKPVSTQVSKSKAATKPVQSKVTQTNTTGDKDSNTGARVTRQNSKLNEPGKLMDVKLIDSKTKKSSSKPKAKDAQVTPKRNSLVIPKSESAVEEKLRTPEDKHENDKIDVNVSSPFVTVSRGKENAIKETKNKLKDGLLSDDAGDYKTVGDFRNQLNSETARLTAVSDEWDKYTNDNMLPDDIQELVRAAVGQTRLLVSKKMQQFSQLVDICELGEAREVVTGADLQGFWDMVFMQVENVDARFKRLSELRECAWVTQETLQPKKRAAASKKKKTKVAASSKIRGMIEAARKAAHTSKTTVQGAFLEATEMKHFETGFFTVTSPVRERASLLTPRLNKSMLKEVLSSEAKKASANKAHASHVMMKASLISKSMDSPSSLALISPRFSPLINLDATPARSILKTPLQRSSRRKSAKTVLFQDKQPSRLGNLEFQTLVITPEKVQQPIITPKKSINRRSRTPKQDQENLEPSEEESPPRRITRNMRRSILQEKQGSPTMQVTVEIPAKPSRRKGRSSARSSIQMTEVH